MILKGLSLACVHLCAGIDGEPVVFLFSDTQIVQEGFLEDINNMLNSGEVPGMFVQVGEQHQAQKQLHLKTLPPSSDLFGCTK